MKSPWTSGRRGLLVCAGFSAGLGAFVFACGSDGNPPAPSACEAGCAEAGADDGGPATDARADGASADAAFDAGDGGGEADAGDGSSACSGPPGTLDPTFGDGGMVWLKYPGCSANAIALQVDGKILVAGHTSGGANAAVVRLHANGSQDTTFGSSGLVEVQPGAVNNAFNALVVQPDGKIIGVGSSRVTGSPSSLTVMRFLPDGSLDPKFGNAGTVLTAYAGRDAHAHSAVLQPDGKIVVAGFSEDAINPTATANFEVIRYDASGTPDPGFGSSGRVTVDIRGTDDRLGVIALAPGGKFLLGGSTKETTALTGRYDMAAVRLNPNGSSDETFANAGIFVSSLGTGTQRASGIAVDASGRVYLGGWFGGGSPDDFAVLRLATSGVSDPTFGSGGTSMLDFAGRTDRSSALLLQDDGKALAVGISGIGAQSDTYGLAAARFSPTGAPDPSFGANGAALSPPPLNSQTGAAAGALDRCSVIAVGTWLYDLNTMAKNAMGVARYRR